MTVTSTLMILMMMMLKTLITLLASKQEAIFWIFLVHAVSQLCLSKLSHFCQTLDVPLVPKPSLYLFIWLMYDVTSDCTDDEINRWLCGFVRQDNGIIVDFSHPHFLWTLSFNVQWVSLVLIFFSSMLSTSKLKRVNAVNQSLDFGM